MPRALSALAVGDKVKDPGSKIFGKPIIWKIADKNHAGYPANSVTLIAERMLIICAFDAKEPSSADPYRRTDGNNRYSLSNVRQWLNSDAPVGAWYAAQHGADEPPSQGNVEGGWNAYDARAGFLNGFSEDFKASLLPTALTVIRNTAADGGGSETVTDKLFLASRTEVGLGDESAIAEGAQLAMFSDNASRLALATQEAVDNDNAKSGEGVGNTMTAWHWWLRTPLGTVSPSVRRVSRFGAPDQNNAFGYTNGVRPLCNLPSYAQVSDAADGDGCYELILNMPPAISGADGDLGVKSGPFSYGYAVTDREGDAVTVVEAVDGAAIREYSPALGQGQNAEVAGEPWIALENGGHALTITASDAFSSSTRTMGFEKSVSSCGFALGEGKIIQFASKPTRMTVGVAREAAAGSAMLVEVCNNANDEAPTWEDATATAVAGLAHVFANEAKTSLHWGVGLRVTLSRNSAQGACRIFGVEGHAE